MHDANRAARSRAARRPPPVLDVLHDVCEGVPNFDLDLHFAIVRVEVLVQVSLGAFRKEAEAELKSTAGVTLYDLRSYTITM